MGRAFGLCEVESFAVPSGVFVSYRKSDGESECGLKRVHRGSTNMMRVNAVNSVSREVEGGGLTVEETVARLRAIQQEPSPYHGWWLLMASALCSGGFSLMFRGGLTEFLLATLIGVLAQGVGMMLERFKMKTLVAVLLESWIIAFLPAAINAWAFPILVEAVVAGGLMPLLPGLAMTNAVQDAMRGDTVSGMSHALSALLTAGLISGGTLAASAMLRMLLGGA